MKSNKQRRAELKARKQAREKKLAAEQKEARRIAQVQRATAGLAINQKALKPHNSYSEPDFVGRGWYVDKPFSCIDCGKEEVWTARQQKWWYEVAKGDVWTTARRCRLCRRKERERKAEARRVSLEGLARKKERLAKSLRPSAKRKARTK